MTPMLTITGPGALWTSRSPARDDPRHDPDPDAYAMFAGAVAARYRDGRRQHPGFVITVRPWSR
jgi:hypothetical protein